jgi:hypothetical protein
VIREAVQVPENLIFSRNSVPFHSVTSFGNGSSAELRMPPNEHFLPRNNGNRSWSIPRNSVPNPKGSRNASNNGNTSNREKTQRQHQRRTLILFLNCEKLHIDSKKLLMLKRKINLNT